MNVEVTRSLEVSPEDDRRYAHPSHFKSTLLALLSGLSIFTGVVLGILLNWQYPQRYIVLEPENHKSVLLGDDSFVVTRIFEVTRDTEFHMSRELIMTDPGGVVTRVELPEVTVFYRKGVHRVDRIQPLPTVRPGIYQYYNHLCWPANFIRTECIDLPVTTLEVTEKLEEL